MPDLMIHHGATVVEYKNPSLLPGMVPTLFPYGIGGFEDLSRSTPIRFQNQAIYYFDIDDHCFSAHLHTYFTIHKSHLDTVANKLVLLSAPLIASIASHLEQEGSYANILPHVYLTMNPNPVHSPIFQVMFGGREVDLSSCFPQHVPSSERALHLAKDPVAAANFFNCSIEMFLEHMLSWN
ncbi:hypothetical protein K439DRAFT_1647778 [Ramaria rubella]|nr:hypothetical protein K439DRAFT_1647778 [Ramaria rubella]